MKIKVQYQGSGTIEYFNKVKGFYSTEGGSIVIVFDNDSTLEIGRPDYIAFVK